MLRDFGEEFKDSESDSINLNFDTNDLPDGETQIFVRICDCDGNCTDSQTMNYKIDNTISLPDTISITSAIYSTGGFQVDWEKSLISDFLKYDLHHSMDPAMENSTIVFTTDSINDNNFLFTNTNHLDRFASNYFYVTVTDTFNYSTNSDIVTTKLLSDSVRIISKEYSEDGFQLAWNISQMNDFSKYDLFHSLDSAMTGATLIYTSNIVSNNSYTFTTSNNDTIYNYNYFYVKVTDTFNYSIMSDTVSTVLLYEPVILDSVESFGTRITLNWSESEDQNFSNYNLYVASGITMSDKSLLFNSNEVSITEYVSVDHNYDQTYFFQVGTKNIWGLEVFSNVQSIRPTQITFSKNYDYDLTNDVGYFGVQNELDAYAILGSNSEDLILLLDNESASNTELITFNYGADEIGVEIQSILGDGYIILSNHIENNNDHDIRITKTNFNGDYSWDFIYGSDGLDSARDMQITFDNGILITGTLDTEPGRVSNDLWLLKTNSSGQEEINTSISYSSDHSSIGAAISEVIGGYVVLGTIEEEQAPQNRNIWLVKFDNSDLENVDTSWSKVFNITNYDYPSDLIITDDGGILFGGYSTSLADNQSERAWIIKTDSDGLNEVTLDFIGHKYIYSVIESNENNFVMAGKKEVNSNMQAWIICVNEAGTIQWENTFGLENEDLFMSVIQTSDGGFLLTGTSKLGSGDSDIFYQKTNSIGSAD